MTLARGIAKGIGAGVASAVTRGQGAGGGVSYDTDALDYFTRVEALGGTFDLTAISSTYTEAYVKAAHDTFVRGLKTDGVWSKSTNLFLHCGKTFAGLPAKLKYVSTSTVTNNNFVTGDYAGAGSSGGLKGNGSTKYLDTNLSILSIDKSSFAMHCYMNSRTGSATTQMMGSSYTATGDNNRFYMGFDSGGTQAAVGNLSPTFTSNAVGLFTMETSGTTTQRLYKNGTLDKSSSSWNNDGFQTGTFFLFLGSGSYSNDRIPMHAITTALSSTEHANFYARIVTFLTALGCA